MCNTLPHNAESHGAILEYHDYIDHNELELVPTRSKRFPTAIQSRNNFGYRSAKLL